MAAYYNEIDEYAAAWLRNLIAAGHIADGDVDTRSIEDVHPIELRGYTQCHFFAGVGVWSRALRLAGWPDDRRVWTGSCPCQPFSAAGKGAGFADERHLWPAWHHLIEECRPATVFGEQVASADGLGWLDLVHADLEAACYAVGAADLCAAGVGAPHIRQRLFFVADAERADVRSSGSRAAAAASRGVQAADGQRQRVRADAGAGGAAVAGLLADSSSARLAQRVGERGVQRGALGALARQAAVGGGDAGLVADAELHDGAGRTGEADADGPVESDRRRDAGATVGFWADAEWIACRDGKWRPVEPGTFPLAHGAPARVGRLRAYGNAIVAEAAATFIRATGV